MKTTFVIFCALISNLVFSQNFAYASRDSILASAPRYADNVKALNVKKENYSKELQDEKKALQKDLELLVSKYKPTAEEDVNAIKKRMTAADAKSLDNLIGNNTKVEEKEKKINELLQLDYNKNISPILTTIDNTIKAYTQKNKIDILYDINAISPALIYINTSKNITKKIIEEVKKAN